MTKKPRFLTVEDVLEIHRRQIEVFGGSIGIRDRPRLESAVAQPQASFGGAFLHTDLFAMAAAYIFHIAQNQAFVDGNKRTALVSGIVFLGLNRRLISDPNGLLYTALIAIAERKLDKTGLAKILANLST